MSTAGLDTIKAYHGRLVEKASPEKREELEAELKAAQKEKETAEEKEDQEAAIKSYTKELQLKSSIKKFPDGEFIEALEGKLDVLVKATSAYTDAEKAYKDQLVEVEKLLGLKASPPMGVRACSAQRLPHLPGAAARSVQPAVQAFDRLHDLHGQVVQDPGC